MSLEIVMNEHRKNASMGASGIVRTLVSIVQGERQKSLQHFPGDRQEGRHMRSQSKILALIGVIVFSATAGYAATIAGTVNGADGAPFQGAFVEAQNAKTKITVIVLSDSQGRYRIPDLAAGDYRVQIRAVGYRADPRSGVTLTAEQDASLDFSLQKSMVRWNEISQYQAAQLWPPAKGKELLFGHCNICHQFQSRMASVRRDLDGWKDRVAFMREAMHFSIFLGPNFSDQDAEEVANYLNTLFGPDSVLPKSPADMPAFQKTVRPFSNEAMNIVYVEYDMPAPSRMPFSAAPDKNGYLWIPDFGLANKITRLDPKTGEMQDFPIPFTGTGGVHSAVPAPDGSVWIAEQGSNRVGRWDPVTQQITEYQDPYVPGKEGIEDGGSKHTVRIDPTGKVWASGVPLTRFDPETGKFAHFVEGEYAYDVKPDKDGGAWFKRAGEQNRQSGRKNDEGYPMESTNAECLPSAHGNWPRWHDLFRRISRGENGPVRPQDGNVYGISSARPGSESVRSWF